MLGRKLVGFGIGIGMSVMSLSVASMPSAAQGINDETRNILDENCEGWIDGLQTRIGLRAPHILFLCVANDSADTVVINSVCRRNFAGDALAQIPSQEGDDIEIFGCLKNDNNGNS